MLRRSLQVAVLVFLTMPLLAADSRPTSEACMSCHDGSAAPQIHRDDCCHPWQIDYELARNSRRVRLRPSSGPSGMGGSVAQDLLVEGNVECSSCHVDHDTYTETKFRLRGETLTALCIACHDVS